jgi:hypothetical protein
MAKYIAVWDPLMRIGHWTIVLAFAVAYLSGEDLLIVHVWAGYIVSDDVGKITAFLDSLIGDQPEVTYPVLPPSIGLTPQPQP